VKLNTEWLTDYVELDAPPEKIARALTESCAVAEAVYDPYAHLAKVVVARLVSAEPLAGSDKLFRCNVDYGEGTATVIAGAPNTPHCVGKLAAYVPPDTVLPFGTVTERELFGAKSAGMLASGLELGLSADHAGLLVLKKGKIGQTLAGLFDVPKTAIIDLETTPNRPDTLSHLGLARQLSAVFGVHFKYPAPRVNPKSVDDGTLVRIECPDLCRRYVGLVVRGVKVGPSPDWLARRLISIGHRPISNVVDVTNYVLHGLGQPLHTFDFSKLGGGRIIVRRACQGEVIFSLEGDECRLTPEMMVIADAERPVAVAGVMGGLESGVVAETTDILIESAWFEPGSVRVTGRGLGLESSSSHLFGRGADPNLAPVAARFAAELITEIGGGTVDDRLHDCHPVPYEPPEVRLRWGRVKKLLGFDVTPEEGKRILTALGCAMVAEDKDGATWSIPSHRPDLAREVDLIEELAQVAGYDNVPVELPRLTAAHLNRPDPERPVHIALAAAGCQEVLTTDFVSLEEAEGLGYAEKNLVAVKNPLDKGHPYLRPSGFIGLLNAARHNASRGADDLRFYEIATVFGVLENIPVETKRLCVLLVGERPADGWFTRARALDFYDLKGVCETLSDALKIATPELVPVEVTEGMPLEITVRLGGAPVGRLLRFGQKLLAAYDLEERSAWGLELELETLLRRAGDVKLEPLPLYPPGNRDLALVFDEGVRHAEILRAIRSAGGGLLEEVRLFDVYVGKQVGAGKRSLAFSLTYRAPDRTLTDEEIDAAHAKIVETLRERFHAELRS
jgi:phenylalanyl-tRNA synthetase beta chain